MNYIRYLVAFMIFMAMFFSYILRTDITIYMIAMAEKKNATIPLPDYGPRFRWTERRQAHLLAAFYYGYVLSTFIGGILAENYGGRNVVCCAILTGGMLSMASPSFAGPQYIYMWGIRFFVGLAVGTILPSCNSLISKWAPPNEKGIFMATLVGGALGTVISRPLLSILIISCSWRWTFYIESLFCVTFAMIWYWLVQNEPKKHMYIKQREIDYINQSLGKSVTTSKKCPPYIRMFSSIPLLALMILHFGNVWGYTFILGYAPKFMCEVLNYDIRKGSFLASVPILARVIVAFFVGYITDVIIRRKVKNVTEIRKLFCLLSHILPGLLLCVLVILSFHHIVTIVLMTISLGLNGAAVATSYHNTQDLAPNYAGSVMSLIEGLANISGFIAPEVVATFLNNKNEKSRTQWTFVFIVAAVVYIFSAIVFLALGSGEIQSWNYSKKEIEEDEELQEKLGERKKSESIVSLDE